MRTIILRTGVISALLVLLACGRTEPAPEAARPVLTQVVEAGVDAGAVSYSGEVRSRYEIPLGFRIGGKIAARLVDNGALVKAGDILARLDPADTALSAGAAVAQLELAAADVRRYRELRGKNFVSQAALDAKETAYTSAKAQADLARNQSAYTELRTDKAGVVELVSAEVGQVVAAGQTVMRVARTDSLEVAIAIPEARMPEVRLRKAAEITLWADQQARYQGVVRELSSTADALTRTYPARVSFLKADDKILLGMTANVRLLRDGAEQRADARVAVPLGAIFQQQGAPALWVVAADQTIALRQVKVAAYGDTRAVLEDGVKAGERIVIAGVHKLTAGEKIKAVDQAPVVAQ
jgi:multidrug efflux system membrane fusion protein